MLHNLHSLLPASVYRGMYARGSELIEEGIAAYRRIEDRWRLCLALLNLGFARARDLFGESLVLARQMEDKELTALVVHNLGDMARYQGDLAAAQALLRDSIKLAGELGDRHLVAMSLIALGQIGTTQGDMSQAHEDLCGGLRLSRDLSDRLCIAQSVAALAGWCAAGGDMQRAAVLLGAHDAMRALLASPLAQIDRPAYDAMVVACTDALGKERLASAGREGAETPVDALVAPSWQSRPRTDQESPKNSSRVRG